MKFFWNSVFGVLISLSAWAQVDVVSFEEFEKDFLEKEVDSLYVINFWATCAMGEKHNS